MFENATAGSASPLDRTVGLARQYVDELRTRHPWVKEHSERVARLSAKIAAQMGLSPEHVKSAELVGALHDIGKLHVPSAILEKPAGLTAQEFMLIQEVPAYSASIAYVLGLSYMVQRGISQRHERPDGLGYPFGTRGAHINLLAKIVAVADTYDSLTHEQPYREAIAVTEAIGIIRSKSFFQFDTDVVDTLTRMSLPPQ